MAIHLKILQKSLPRVPYCTLLKHGNMVLRGGGVSWEPQERGMGIKTLVVVVIQ